MTRGRTHTLKYGLDAWVHRVNRSVGHPGTVASQAREMVQPKSLKNGSRADCVMMSEVMFGGALATDVTRINEVFPGRQAMRTVGSNESNG